MSHFSRIKTKLANKDCLVKALQGFGFEPEIHETAQHLYGYRGDRRVQTAEIIVRRNQIDPGASNDLGFKWNEKQNCYEILISDYDRRRGRSHRNRGLGTQFVDNLNREYAKHIVLEKAQQLGDECTVTERMENGVFAGYTIVVEKPSQLLAGESTISNQLFTSY